MLQLCLLFLLLLLLLLFLLLLLYDVFELLLFNQIDVALTNERWLVYWWLWQLCLSLIVRFVLLGISGSFRTFSGLALLLADLNRGFLRGQNRFNYLCFFSWSLQREILRVLSSLLLLLLLQLRYWLARVIQLVVGIFIWLNVCLLNISIHIRRQ